MNKDDEACLIIIIYVDYMIISSRIKEEIQRIKDLIRERFDMRGNQTPSQVPQHD
jgi:hypothetical protein